MKLKICFPRPHQRQWECKLPFSSNSRTPQPLKPICTVTLSFWCPLSRLKVIWERPDSRALRLAKLQLAQLWPCHYWRTSRHTKTPGKKSLLLVFPHYREKNLPRAAERRRVWVRRSSGLYPKVALAMKPIREHKSWHFFEAQVAPNLNYNIARYMAGLRQQYCCSLFFRGCYWNSYHCAGVHGLVGSGRQCGLWGALPFHLGCLRLWNPIAWVRIWVPLTVWL